MIELVEELEADVDRRRDETEEILTRAYSADSSSRFAPDTSRIALLERATYLIRHHRGEVQELASATTWASRRANRFRVEIHKKFSIAFACFVFVLMAIPLGLRVRKGGLGVVSALSIGIFLAYWVSLVQGEKLADRGLLDPWFGMWIANILIGMVAVVLLVLVSVDLRNRRVRTIE